MEEKKSSIHRKKLYITPTIRVVEIEPGSLIAESPGANTDGDDQPSDGPWSGVKPFTLLDDDMETGEQYGN